MMEDFKIVLSTEEKNLCLKEIDKRLKRILYVYEQSTMNIKYDYKAYVYSVIIYISSFNSLFNFDLTNIIINLNSLLTNDFKKSHIRKIVLECKHIICDLQQKGD